MDRLRVLAACVLGLGLGLAGCDGQSDASRHTAVLGGNGNPSTGAESGTSNAGGPLPPPPAAAGTQVLTVGTGEDAAVAVWVQDGHVLASTFARPRGWSPAQPLETIYGVATDPQLASNGRGAAIAVWRHTVGSIQSLRFSRFDAASGWSTPDVLPGALPRPKAEGAAAPQLSIDGDGKVTARWPSGFAANEEQVARYTPGQGWSRAVSAPLPAPSGSPARPAPSSAR
jgi:hypothetical protein